jgi:phage terminase small subunit
MAGVKGRSGGARPGAGRKPNEPEILMVAGGHDDPLQFLIDVMNDVSADAKLRVDAAKALMPFKHQKLGEGGKKEQKQKDAEKVAGRFSAAAPPRLVAAGGRKV